MFLPGFPITPSFTPATDGSVRFGPPFFLSPQISLETLRAQLTSFSQTIDQNMSTTLDLIGMAQVAHLNLKRITDLLHKPRTPPSLPTRQQQEEEDCSYEQYLEDNSHSGKSIIRDIFGQKHYKFQICLSESFDSVLYKNKNFSISVKLVDRSGNVVVNSNRVPITLSAYLIRQTPILISQTRFGKSVFRGNNESYIQLGEGRLTKLNFREVSRNCKPNMISFVVYSKPQPQVIKYEESVRAYKQRLIDPDLIRPLVLTDIIVKAKKK